MRSETQTGNFPVPVNEAFDYSGNTYDFYKEIFSRSSVDGKDMRLDSTVHYGCGQTVRPHQSRTQISEYRLVAARRVDPGKKQRKA